MNTIIEKLSHIESQSTAVMDDANEKKKAFAKEIASRTSLFDQELERATEQRIQALRQEKENELEHKLKTQQQKATQLLDIMEHNYHTYHGDYVNTLFESLIKE